MKTQPRARGFWQVLSRPVEFLTKPRAGEGLAQRVTLAFGFMAFIPLLMIVWALLSYVLPNVEESVKDTLGLIVMAVIVSMFVGYSVLKRTMHGVMAVVHHARTVTPGQLAEPSHGDRDEIVELTRTFNRITQELEQKIEALESSRTLIKRLLSRIGTAIVSFEGIETVLEMIMEQSCAAMEAQAGSLLILNDATQQLEPKVGWSLDGRRVPTQPVRLGEGIAGSVAKAMKPMRGTGSLPAIGVADHAAGDGEVLCVPMAIREKPLGVLAVFRASMSRAFTEDDEALLTSIGSQVAVAVENYQLNQDIERTYLEAIMALALAVEAKEAYTAGHSKRVAFYAQKIAELMGLDEDARKLISNAGLLHDVGKIGVKDVILLKPEALTPEELHVMRQHPSIGEAILKPLRSLGKVAEMVHCHHEHYDGSGYPRGLKGEQIPLGARILVVADSYDSMVTDRPYRKRLSLEEAKDELCKWAGTHFDPQAVKAFLRFLDEKEPRLGRAPSA
ncbi:MAG: HD domain-containing protein [Candidatus Omnitrophica bacterium]|nr:HD domain-containing protein [Candidatus Omnitrophota bacterium]